MKTHVKHNTVTAVHAPQKKKNRWKCQK